MTIQPSPAWLAGLLACTVATTAARAATVEVYAYLGEDEAADLVLLADGKDVCAIKVANLLAAMPTGAGPRLSATRRPSASRPSKPT